MCSVHVCVCVCMYVCVCVHMCACVCVSKGQSILCTLKKKYEKTHVITQYYLQHANNLSPLVDVCKYVYIHILFAYLPICIWFHLMLD